MNRSPTHDQPNVSLFLSRVTPESAILDDHDMYDIEAKSSSVGHRKKQRAAYKKGDGEFGDLVKAKADSRRFIENRIGNVPKKLDELLQLVAANSRFTILENSKKSKPLPLRINGQQQRQAQHVPSTESTASANATANDTANASAIATSDASTAEKVAILETEVNNVLQNILVPKLKVLNQLKAAARNPLQPTALSLISKDATGRGLEAFSNIGDDFSVAVMRLIFDEFFPVHTRLENRRTTTSIGGENAARTALHSKSRRDAYLDLQQSQEINSNKRSFEVMQGDEQ